ncbi:uncharacterized protein AB675_8296 [Cyphellophora attinorum]|uniref:Uncharacterized protein n=1 Tax=Cyphellophora attinorum TaxID=1664694 RepID=A0A0N1HFF1_9EURO|nr:uncharacterized protein AB675_8296 [Phialophora attinorum]KPI44463.1 hypothetical protein AB675_8296 [Phialophora attinorum]
MESNKLLHEGSPAVEHPSGDTAQDDNTHQSEASAKVATAAIATEVQPVEQPKADTVQGETLQGATLSLLIGAFFPCIPVALVCSILLSIILGNQIKAPFVVLEQVHIVPVTGTINQTLTAINSLKKGGDDVYWLWAKTATTPGTLHTIASVTGKVMPFITSSTMALVAFFAGRRLIQVSRKEKKESMPTPYQMSLLINLLNGSGIQPLWNTSHYWWTHHIPLVRPVILAFWSLTWIVVITLLIQIADSWFGVAVQPATVDIVRSANTTSAFGRQFDPAICDTLFHNYPCIGDSSTICSYPCSITTWNSSSGQARFGLQHAQEAAQVLMNNSRTDFVVNVTTTDRPEEKFFFMGDLKSSTSHDFETETLAVTTECQVVTQNCEIGEGFTCGSYKAPSFAWTGAVGVEESSATGPTNQSNAGIQYFNDPGLTVPIGRGNATDGLFSSQNPTSFLAWSKGFPPVDTKMDLFTYMRENNFLGSDASGDPVFILNCSIMIYQATYNWSNGGVAADGLYDLRPADPAYGAVLSGGFALNTALSHLALQDAAALAAYQERPEGLARVFAESYSKAAVALTAGITIPSKNIFDQERWNNVLVTRVPKIPLYVLVAFKGIYALFALVLAILAVTYADPMTSQEVKERLTIDGLAVGLFEADAHLKSGVREMQQLFDEHNRTHDGVGDRADDMPTKVGMVQNENGGWTWKTTAQVADSFGFGVGVDEIKARIVNAV